MANEKRLDLIDRNAILEAIDKSDRDNFHKGVANRSIHHYEHVHFLKMVLDAPTVDAVEVKIIKAWLYQIAMNNVGVPVKDLAEACEEIISRLDGLRKFAGERESEDG